MDWVKCSQQMVRFVGRQEFMRSESDHAVSELLRALSDEPEVVELIDGGELKVYPKSFAALSWFDMEGWWIHWLGVRVTAIQLSMDEKEKGEGTVDWSKMPNPLSAIDAALGEMNHRTALICWAACHEGPRLPWKYGADEYPAMDEMPEVYVDLHPLDVNRIQMAFLKVNAVRLKYLPKAQDGKTVTRDRFFANRAKQTRRPAKELMMEVSLSSQIAEAALASVSLEDIG